MLSLILFLVFVPLAAWVCSVDEKHFDRQSGELHSTLNDAYTDTVQLQSDIFELVLSSSTLPVLCIVRTDTPWVKSHISPSRFDSSLGSDKLYLIGTTFAYFVVGKDMMLSNELQIPSCVKESSAYILLHINVVTSSLSTKRET